MLFEIYKKVINKKIFLFSIVISFVTNQAGITKSQKPKANLNKKINIITKVVQMIISHIPKPSNNIKKITIKNNIIEIMPVINENKRIAKSVFYKLIFLNTPFNHKDLVENFFFSKDIFK